MCRLFQAGSLQCRAVGREEYLPLMVEKLLWSCIFWLLSDALGGLPVRRTWSTCSPGSPPF